MGIRASAQATQEQAEPAEGLAGWLAWRADWRVLHCICIERSVSRRAETGEAGFQLPA